MLAHVVLEHARYKIIYEDTKTFNHKVKYDIEQQYRRSSTRSFFGSPRQ